MNARSILIALYLKNKKDWDAMYKDIVNKVIIDVDYWKDKFNEADYITIVDPDYPEDLKKYTVKPPFVIEK